MIYKTIISIQGKGVACMDILTLKELKKEFSIRQLQRITGISRGVRASWGRTFFGNILLTNRYKYGILCFKR